MLHLLLFRNYMINYRNLKKSARYAARGMVSVWREEQNFRIEIFGGFVAIFVGLVLRFTFIELSIIVLLVGSILAAECVNTSLERIVDILKPRVSEYVQIVKDILAAMMAILVIASVLIAFFLYVPKIVIVLAIVIQAIFH